MVGKSRGISVYMVWYCASLDNKRGRIQLIIVSSNRHSIGSNRDHESIVASLPSDERAARRGGGGRFFAASKKNDDNLKKYKTPYEIKPFCDAPPFLTLYIPEPDPMLQSTVTLC